MFNWTAILVRVYMPGKGTVPGTEKWAVMQHCWEKPFKDIIVHASSACRFELGFFFLLVRCHSGYRVRVTVWKWADLKSQYLTKESGEKNVNDGRFLGNPSVLTCTNV